MCKVISKLIICPVKNVAHKSVFFDIARSARVAISREIVIRWLYVTCGARMMTSREIVTHMVDSWQTMVIIRNMFYNNL